MKPIYYFAFLLTAFVLFSGALGSCLGPDYIPAEIIFDSPLDGTILAPGTESVVIRGYVKKGHRDILWLRAKRNSRYLSFNRFVALTESTPEKFSFEYEFPLNPEATYSTCTFKVTDKNGIVNRARISFAVGEAKAKTESVDDGIRVALTEEGLNNAVGDLIGTINEWKSALIYGVDHPTYGCLGDQACEMLVPSIMDVLPDIRDVSLGQDSVLPIRLDLPSILGDVVVNPNEANHSEGHLALGYINIGHLDIQEGEKVAIDFSVNAESAVNDFPGSRSGDASLFIYGYHNNMLTGHPHIMLEMSEDLVLINAAGNIVPDYANNGIKIEPDFSGAKLALTGCDMFSAEYGMLHSPGDGWDRIVIVPELCSPVCIPGIPCCTPGVSIEICDDILLPMVEPLVHEILRGVAKGLVDYGTGGSIMDFDMLGINLAGVDFNIYPMPDDIMTTNDLLAASLGINSASSVSNHPQMVNYISTPNTDVGDRWSFVNSDQELLLAVSDDMLNNTLFSVYQSDILFNYQATPAFQSFLENLLGELNFLINERMTATVNLTVPPVCDFSGGEDSGPFGRIIVPNIIVDIQNLIPMPKYYGHEAKLSVDLDAKLDIYVDEDGNIKGGIDEETSKATVIQLYGNFGNAGLLPPISLKLINALLNEVLEEVIDDVILSTLNNIPLDITYIQGELINDYLHLKVNPTF